MAAICHLVVVFKARAIISSNYVPFPVRGRLCDVIAEEAIVSFATFQTRVDQDWPQSGSD